MAKPTHADLNMAKNVLKYIKGTLDFGLLFKKRVDNNKCDIVGFSDADYANSTGRKSISGFLFMLSENGPVISWKSKKQQTVALSSCESEYISLSFAAQEAKFLQQLYFDISGKSSSVLLRGDNMGSLSLAKNPVNHQRSKHIDVRYHFIRSLVDSKLLNLEYVSSDNNAADIFTKPVNKGKLAKFITLLRGY